MKTRKKTVYFYYFILPNSSFRFDYTFLSGQSKFSNAVIYEVISGLNYITIYIIATTDGEIEGFAYSKNYRPSIFRYITKCDLDLKSHGFNNYFYNLCLEQYGNALTNIDGLKIKARDIAGKVRKTVYENYLNNIFQ